METENISRKIKVYCYEHQTTCEVSSKPQIVCTVEEHALSNNFPYADFWEYCCDCQTFLPTKPEVTGDATVTCPNCDRSATRRFVCQTCKIASFESDEPARGKHYRLSDTGGIEPDCPGCQNVLVKGSFLEHQCENLNAKFFTARQVCPFCLEKIWKTNIPDESVTADKFLVCSQCHSKNPSTANFCGKCNNQLKKDIEIAKRGDDVSKTQLLGSLCPNCSTPIPPGFDFCGECGQSVKKAIPPPPPPPPRPATNENFSVSNMTTDIPVSASTGAASNNTTRNIVVGMSVFFVVIIIVTIIANTSKPPTIAYNSNTYPASNNYPNSNLTGNRPTLNISKTPNANSSDSRIGRTGTLNMDSNVREFPNKGAFLMGTHYRGARVKILDVATVPNSSGGTTDWFRIEVLSYGNSMDPSKYGQYGKDDRSEDYGWVNSYPEVYEGTKKVRRTLVNFD